MTPKTPPIGKQDELRDTVILAIGTGNWKRMHEYNQAKLLAKLNAYIERIVEHEKLEARHDEIQAANLQTPHELQQYLLDRQDSIRKALGLQ